jgi:hypothetical protein
MDLRRLSILIGLVLTLGARTALGDDYTYENLVLSRDSGLTCMGKSASDESHLKRTPDGGIRNFNSNMAEVYCPLNRRNTTGYGQDPNMEQQQHFMLSKLTIYVTSDANNNNCGVMSCRVFAYDPQAQRVYESNTKYVCNTDGGCTAPPNPSCQKFGHRTIKFHPYEKTTESPLQVDSERLINIGYTCTLPAGVTSSIIGSEGEFVPD